MLARRRAAAGPQSALRSESGALGGRHDAAVGLDDQHVAGEAFVLQRASRAPT